MQPARSPTGWWRFMGNLWRSLDDRTGRSHNARNTAATFDVFLRLQVASFDVSLLRSTPDGADHIDIDIFVLHTCTPPPRYGSNKNLRLGSRQFLNVCIDNPDCSFFTRLLTRIATESVSLCVRRKS